MIKAEQLGVTLQSDIRVCQHCPDEPDTEQCLRQRDLPSAEEMLNKWTAKSTNHLSIANGQSDCYPHTAQKRRYNTRLKK